MTVLYVLRYYPTLTETFVYREIIALQRRGIAVEIVAGDQREDGALADDLPAVPVTYLPRGWRGLPALLPPLRAATSPRARSAWRWLSVHQGTKAAARALWLAEHARRIRATRMHVHFAGEAGEWARAAAEVVCIPYSLTVHAVDLFCPRTSLFDLLHGAQSVVTVARYHQDTIRKQYGVDAQLVRCGVEPQRYVPATPDSLGRLKIVCVGRNVPKKGMNLLVNSVQSSAVPMQLTLVGDAPQSWASERVAVKMLPPSQVSGELAQAHVFALPCRVADSGDRDGIPVAMMEAMAAGLPVVTTPVSGIPELVDDEVGWLVPPDDGVALRQTLEEVARLPADRAERGRAARQRVVARGFTVDAQVDGLLRAWKGSPRTLVRPCGPWEDA